MQAFLSSVFGVAEIIILIAVGYWLSARHWLSAQSGKIIAKIITQVALPAYMVVTVSEKFTASELIRLLPDLRYPLISMAILGVLSAIVALFLRVDRSRIGLFCSMFLNSNTVFIGLPLNMALFGARSVPYVLVYYMANTTVFWTVGVYLIQRDGPGDAEFDFKRALGKIFSPPLLGFIVGIIIVMLHIQLPNFLSADLEYVGDLTVPGSMFFIGITIQQSGIRNALRLDKDFLGVLLGRFIFAPLIMSILLAGADMPALMKTVFIIQSCMPVMTNAPVVARLYDADSEFAAVGVAGSTVLAMVAIPIVMTLIH
ncbi:AEC family transporter [Lacticaseibacillus thailandensis]|uniref:Auxin efflux carrier (AEC) family permease n=1 Tax=Lacticaseibacillus thailandensis DSM 22698 = JCM 13996 TaxID=1423810 RepID=A0A0R2CG53_9LACO|nr:AEC family transporter [Lacticaseibacillus thailandensis]KRM86627.1 Auxin efflux carrier (AEC) family permease [Lacticaseibacillus thailandensis DSM 22698 = JCM 13996]